MNLYEEAREDVLLELIALCSDFPYTLLDWLPGSREWTGKIVRALIRDKLIRRYKNNGVTSLRLTKKARTMLLSANYQRFHGLVDGAGELRARKTDIVSRKRTHAIAEALLFLIKTGAVVHKDEKPAIFSEAYQGGPLILKSPTFYTSIEVKAQSLDLIRIQSTRAVGVYFTPSWRTYLVYNTGNGPLKWSSRSECKLTGAVEGILAQRKVHLQEIKGIMFGDSMQTALELLNSTGGFKRQYYRVDDTFPALHYIPLNGHGQMVLRLLCEARIQKQLSTRLLHGMERPAYPRYVCDAIHSGKVVLLAFTFDFVRLKHFKNGLELFNEQGLVFCFDFQAEVLKSYFGSLAEIRTLDSDKMGEAFIHRA